METGPMFNENAVVLSDIEKHWWNTSECIICPGYYSSIIKNSCSGFPNAMVCNNCGGMYVFDNLHSSIFCDNPTTFHFFLNLF